MPCNFVMLTVRQPRVVFQIYFGSRLVVETNDCCVLFLRRALAAVNMCGVNQRCIRISVRGLSLYC